MANVHDNAVPGKLNVGYFNMDSRRTNVYYRTNVN